MTVKAVVLLSGGLDSATAAAIAKSEGYQLFGLTVTYGQTHDAEIKAAARIVQFLGFAEHRILEIPLGQWGGSLLIRPEIVQGGTTQVPSFLPGSQIPPTYVPARNTVFLSLALAWAEVLDAEAICIGVNAMDYSGYPDCRPDFIDAFQRLARLATKKALEENRWPEILAPLLHLTKAQIVTKALTLGLDLSLTHSCYFPDPHGIACGTCDSCVIRQRGFAEAGVADPIPYQRRT